MGLAQRPSINISLGALCSHPSKKLAPLGPYVPSRLGNLSRGAVAAWQVAGKAAPLHCMFSVCWEKQEPWS